MINRPSFLKTKVKAKGKLAALKQKLNALKTRLPHPNVGTIHTYRSHALRNKLLYSVIISLILFSVVGIFMTLRIQAAKPGDLLFFPKQFIEKYIQKADDKSIIEDRIKSYSNLLNKDKCVQSEVARGDLETKILNQIADTNTINSDLISTAQKLHGIQNVETTCITQNLFSQYADIFLIVALQREGSGEGMLQIFNDRFNMLKDNFALITEILQDSSFNPDQEDLDAINGLLVESKDFLSTESVQVVDNEILLDLLKYDVAINSATSVALSEDPIGYQSHIVALCNVLNVVYRACDTDKIQSQLNSTYFQSNQSIRINQEFGIFKEVLELMDYK